MQGYGSSFYLIVNHFTFIIPRFEKFINSKLLLFNDCCL
jgi:hypothetical protein